MHEWVDSEDGYIVFEEDGILPMAIGVDENWFKTYDEAVNYAMSIVAREVENFKTKRNANMVMIYKGPESLLHETHEVPGNHKVIFMWSNFDIS